MKQLKEVKFDIIRYANCWEDAELLLQGLDVKSGNKVLSIASGGDNSFSLLTTNPELVVAIDINQIQLFVVELKKEAIRMFDQKTFIQFVGFEECENRIEKYSQLRENISPAAQHYWDNNQHSIKKGIVHSGKFEQYFQKFCTRILPLIHSKNTIIQLLSTKSDAEQKAFVESKWNTKRWRFLFKLFFSRFVLGRLGRDPKFLKEVNIKVSDYLLQKANAYLSSSSCQNNWMLRYILLGKFDGLLPHYVQEKNYKSIKQNISKLRIVNGLVEDAVDKFGKFDVFNLSNIFEYMDIKTFNHVSSSLLNSSEEQAKMAYWNLMVPRMISHTYENVHRCIVDKNDDKGFFYRDFIVEQIH